MVCGWTGNKQLNEPMVVSLTDTYMRHSASIDYKKTETIRLSFYQNIYGKINARFDESNFALHVYILT